MSATQILLVVFCLVAFNRNGDSKRYTVSHERDAVYQQLVDLARKEIGTREGDVPNTGQKVSAYLRYTGINRPAPWCAAWVSYVYGQAGLAAPRTAWSPALFPASRQVKAPKAGLILGIYYTQLGRIGHCGIVEKLVGSYVYSIEGNTSASNERDGDGVWRKIRHRRSIRCYADWVQHLVSKKGVAHER